MKYIFDFDRTLFDTDAFKLAAVACGIPVGSTEIFSHVDVAQFVYPDAHLFLEAHDTEQIYIVSSCIGTTRVWDQAYQREKIMRSGIAPQVQKVHVVPTEKVATIKDIVCNNRAVFVDDIEMHVRAVAEQCPTVSSVRIARNGPVSSSVPVIRTLTELDAMIETLCP